MNSSVYQPNLAQFRQLAKDGANLIPVYRELPADLETPVSVYLKLMADHQPSFLLESVEGGEQVGRYSFVGVNPRGLLALQGNEIRLTERDGGFCRHLAEKEDLLHVLQKEIERFVPAQLPGLPRFIGGAVGYLGYDLVRFWEKVPASAPSILPIPDALFLLADSLVVFDHARHHLLVLTNAHLSPDVEQSYLNAIERIERISEKLLRPLPAIPHHRWGMPATTANQPLQSNFSQTEYEAIVEQAKEQIAAGEIFQVVLSQRLSRHTSAHPFAIYRSLRMLNPSPYMFYFDFGSYDLQLIGSSPEMHVRLEENIATVRPIAGTRPRGQSETADKALANDLLADEKERAEHLMLVDLGRNDLGRVSQYGTVKVKEFMTIERYSHVMHIVSQVEGQLKPGMTAYDLLRATFPAGTVSGAPKVRAMQLIEELERERRGLYAGAVGYIGYDGSMDTCIAIRTMIMQGDIVYIQAGAGIVADSIPAQEYQECLNKARALAVAIEKAESGER